MDKVRKPKISVNFLDVNEIFSGYISHVNWLKITDISGTICVPIIRVWYDIITSDSVGGAKMTAEMLVIFKQLTWTVAQEDTFAFVKASDLMSRLSLS
jgi:hypothetical protein